MKPSAQVVDVVPRRELPHGLPGAWAEQPARGFAIWSPGP